ncbi:hypothetical protein PINS_up000423 [Pythium insidiosum]|nr:hypothetical protein PINS_up000423 [Pythium insidiosum]
MHSHTHTHSHDLGEIVLTMAGVLPARKPQQCALCLTNAGSSAPSSASPTGSWRGVRRRCGRLAGVVDGHGVLFVSSFFMVASQVVLTVGVGLSERLQQFIGGILLAATAGTMYLLFCLLLCAWESPVGSFAELLLRRSNPFVWRRDKLRFFMEVCSWMASVWYSYTTFHSEVLSICGGAVTATALAIFSDVAAAYLRYREAQFSKDKKAPSEQVAWLKVGFSYIGVGYVITGNWRNLCWFLSGEQAEFRSIEDLVFSYLLITLVGVSLIVASELLLLYEPTRRAGITLQSRIVDARANWERRTLRSLGEATSVFATTVISYHWTQDVLTSLQLGTITGVVIILSSDFLSPSAFLFSQYPSRPSEDALPSDHWVKLLPIGVTMLYFCYQVVSAIITLVALQSHEGLMLVWFVAVCALALTVVGFVDNREAVQKLQALMHRFGGGVCCCLVALVAFKMCLSYTSILFSGGLSWFCLSLSRECWDEIEAKRAWASPITADDSPQLHHQKTAVGESDEVPRSINEAATVMRYVRMKYQNLYTRVKWTFICIVVLSMVDSCSTIFLALHSDLFSVTLSQFSACNVAVSAGVGYLTSSVHQELRPEVLVSTGMKHFKNKLVLFPLHALVETVVFVGVFIGTFTTTSTLFSSLTLASLSGIVISVGGHWVCSRLQLDIGNHARVQLTGTCALVFCVFLFGWMSFICVYTIYHNIDNIEAAFCLASLAGVAFLASTELFLLWEPTRAIGHILQRRVTHARENWQAEPLRSFLEFFTWLAVICGSFALYDDLLLALHVGTFSGIAVTLSGEYYRRRRPEFISWEDDRSAVRDAEPSSESREAANLPTNDSERPRVLPAMLLFAYIGSGTFQWIFENIRRIEVTVILATFAGFAFLCVADLLVHFKPTRWAGVILQDRFLRAQENWQENPVRSFVELGCFLGVIYGSYAIYGDLIVATQVGTVSGMLVALIGEQLRSHTQSLPLSDDVELEKTKILPLPVMSLLGLVGAVAFNIIYTHLRSIEVAFALATTSGIAFALLGDMFVIWKPTRRVGLILQERIVYIRYNLRMHPFRSWIELGSLGAGWYTSYVFLWPNDLLVSTQFGTFAGILACVCDELITDYFSRIERKLIERATHSGQHVQNSQINSGFLSLPYEVQFEVARFLAPEDLLVARATCHKINNMLKAEAARYWLHASLRRKFGVAARANRMGHRARSLVYEAVRLVIPKIFSTRTPVDVLTSNNGLSRALKWVYMNADWIRGQNLPPLSETCTDPHIILLPGDSRFEVFRHMPDKSHLNVMVQRGEDLSINRIEVPVAVYAKLQTDPFSFVAAETLSEVDAFSNWHVAFVAFFAMTLIFIGQFSSDILRQHILPPSFSWPS